MRGGRCSVGRFGRNAEATVGPASSGPPGTEAAILCLRCIWPGGRAWAPQLVVWSSGADDVEIGSAAPIHFLSQPKRPLHYITAAPARCSAPDPLFLPR
jgi:hypothetical protein